MDHSLAYGFQQVLNTLHLAAFYLPLAVAFAMIQAITRRIFLGFGDFAMFASFVAIYVTFDSMLRGGHDALAGILGIAGALACGAALGIVVSRLMLSRKLLGNPLAFMIGSIGLAIFIQEVMRISSGSANIWIPPLFEGQSMISFTGTFPVRFGTMSAIHVAVSVAAVLAACWFIFKTPFGLHWRACAQNPRLASLCGIDATHVAMLTFAISGALAGVTGWSSAIAYGGANFSSGLMAGFKAMFASVIGGFGTVKGAVAGALLLAVVEVVWSAYFSASYRDVAVFGLIIIALVFRPEGLFGMWNDVRLARGEES